MMRILLHEEKMRQISFHLIQVNHGEHVQLPTTYPEVLESQGQGCVQRTLLTLSA